MVIKYDMVIKGINIIGKISGSKSIVVPKIMFKAAKLPVILPDSYSKKLANFYLSLFGDQRGRKLEGDSYVVIL